MSVKILVHVLLAFVTAFLAVIASCILRSAIIAFFVRILVNVVASDAHPVARGCL